MKRECIDEKGTCQFRRRINGICYCALPKIPIGYTNDCQEEKWVDPAKIKKEGGEK